MWTYENLKKLQPSLYRTAFNAAADCIFMVNRKCQIVEANLACGEVFAWPAGMFAPMRFDTLIFDIVDPAYAGATVSDLLHRELRDGVLVVAQSFDGRKFRAEMQIAAVHGTSKVSHIIYLRETVV